MEIQNAPAKIRASSIILLFPVTVFVAVTAGIVGTRALAGVSGDTHQPILKAYGQRSMSFEENCGQTSSEVKYLSRGVGYTLFLTSEEAVLALRKYGTRQQNEQDERAKPEEPSQPQPEVSRTAEKDTAVVRMRLIGANSSAQVEGEQVLPGKSNYLIGKDLARWRTNVPHYRQVRYEAVYPGIDLVFYGDQRQLEYDFVVASGADPGNIRLAFRGENKLSLDKQGNLILDTPIGKIIQYAPRVYQDVDGGQQEIDGRYVLAKNNEVRFKVGSYDAEKALVIDPVLIYSTYLGGSMEFGGGPGLIRGNDIAVDRKGNAYITGRAVSTDFPTTKNALQRDLAGQSDAFVTKLNAKGDKLVYSTYLGGDGGELGRGIALDYRGNAYVTGLTSSADFPVINPLQSNLAGFQDAFIAKLNTKGDALIYSTYLGGSGENDSGEDIAVDKQGKAYVTGNTDSTDFPTANALQPVSGGFEDGFAAKVNARGTAFVYSTYLGGHSTDYSNGIAVDRKGNAYVTGQTSSIDFPTVSPLQQTLAGNSDTFVTKLNARGDALIYSTYLGGRANDIGNGIATDHGGKVYITGWTNSADFPIANALQPFLAGSTDPFVAKLNSSGNKLVYSTYLGGSASFSVVEAGDSIAVDRRGNAYVAGFTDSSDFPTINAFQSVSGGFGDAFVAKLNASGDEVIYSSYLGGSRNEAALGIAVDRRSNVYVTGTTNSLDFPTADPLQASLAGTDDAFVAKIGPETVRIDDCETRVENRVVTDGNTIMDLIEECEVSAANHGAFVSCVAKLARGLKNDGIISGKQKGAIQRCAARANIPR